MASLPGNIHRPQSVGPSLARVGTNLEERSDDRKIALLSSNVQRRHPNVLRVPRRCNGRVGTSLEERADDLEMHGERV